MRKLKTFIYFFITFIFLSSPIQAKASSVALTTESLQLLNNGIDFLSYSGSVPYGFLPFVFSSEKNYQNVLENMLQKQDVFIVDGNSNIQIRPLSQDEYSLLENAYIYDEDGNIVSLQELYYGEVDNGYFTEKFYCKNDGTIVYQDGQKGNPYIDVKFGGSELSYLQWQNTYSALYNDLASNSFIYPLHPNVSPYSVYINAGYYWPYGAGDRRAGYIFVPNGFIKGQTIYQADNLQLIIYTTDLNSLVLNQYYPTSNNREFFYIFPGTYNINGDTYNYQIYFNGTYQGYSLITTPISSYSDFLNDNSMAGYVFDRVNYSTSMQILNSTDVVPFQKVQANSDTIDFTTPYSYGSLSDYMDTIDAIETYPNTSFDSTNSITELNYPLVFDIDTAISDVVIPFPETVVVDDTPAIDYPLDDTIDPTLISNNIPIVQGLQNKFPFSIPWDIYNLISGLSVTRETPSIKQTIEIPISQS